MGNSRPSASAALQHRFFKGSFVMPKIFPKELQDPPVVHVLPTFEGVAQKFSSAAKNVVNPSRVNLPVPTLEQSKDKKAKVKVFSYPWTPLIPNVANMTASDKQSSGLKNVKTKEFENVRTVGPPHFNPASLSTAHILSSSSVVTEKLSHVIQDAFNGRPDTSGSKKVDMVTTGSKKVDVVTRPQPASEVKPSVEDQEKSSRPSDSKRTDTVFTSIGAALPTAATSAITLATGWLV